MRTSPVLPLTSISDPSVILFVPSVTEITHGRPNSRLTITAWLLWPPTSTTTAPAVKKSGVHDGSVSGATRILVQAHMDLSDQE